MILHLINDDKFVQYVVQQFVEGYAGSVVVDFDSTGQFRYAQGVERIKRVTYGKAFHELKLSLGQYNAVIFHGLFGSWCAELIKAIPDNVVIAWVMWDGEVFGREDVIQSMLSPITKCLRNAKQLYRRITKGKKSCAEYCLPHEIFHRIKYCLCDMPQECVVANNYFGTQMQWLPYNYYSIDKTIGTLYDARVKGNNVFIGNACTYQNNHIEAFLKVRKCLQPNQQVIVPLSYGDEPLKKHIIRTGKILLGKAFEPLLQFMPLEEYNQMMLSCSVMIQNHPHPQAQGNIIVGLWLGMRVYLQKKNITYQFFKSLGVNVYSIEDDFRSNNPNLFAPLSDEEIEQNRRVLVAYYSYEATIQRVDKIRKTIQ